VRIVLLGHGSRRRAIEDYADGVGTVTILDPLPAGRFENALRAADCLLLHERPGVLEMSVPGKLTTYFTAGKPVIAATHETSGAAALMRAAGAGVVVPAGDAASLLDAIEEVAADPDRAAKYGANGRAYAAEYLTGKASLERQESWVRRLAQTPARRPPRRPLLAWIRWGWATDQRRPSIKSV
jgi:colanic acid biosynthesis glycosyl transferase WcaI